MSRPSSTELRITARVIRWNRTSRKSRRPHQGVSSHSTITNSASRKVRYSDPMYCGRSAVSRASAGRRVARQRNTFGRKITRRLRVSATSSATWSEPWVMDLPITDGIGTSVPTKPSPLRNSRPQVKPTRRRTERSRAVTGSTTTARPARNSAMGVLTGRPPCVPSPRRGRLALTRPVSPRGWLCAARAGRGGRAGRGAGAAFGAFAGRPLALPARPLAYRLAAGAYGAPCRSAGPWVRPRLSSPVSAPSRIADTSWTPPSRIISPTACTRVHVDWPVVTSTAAAGAQLTRWPAPSIGSRCTRVSSSPEDAHAALSSAAAVCSAAGRSGPDGGIVPGSATNTVSCCSVRGDLMQSRGPDPEQPGGRCSGHQVGQDDLLALPGPGHRERHQGQRGDLRPVGRHHRQRGRAMPGGSAGSAALSGSRLAR